jgi:hypothetical protein
MQRGPRLIVLGKNVSAGLDEELGDLHDSIRMRDAVVSPLLVPDGYVGAMRQEEP